MRVAFLSTALFAIVLTGCGGDSTSTTQIGYATSLTHMKKLGTSILQYANDYDDVLPPVGTWVDSTLPYAKDVGLYHSPLAEGAYGYGLNADLAGKAVSAVTSAGTTPLLFDTIVISRNATVGVRTMPSPPRYGAKNTILYADGSLQDGNLVTDPPGTESELAVSRLKAVAAGFAMYQSDYDDTLPLGSSWVDSTLPYVKTLEAYRSPAVEKQHPDLFGYAYNGEVAGQVLSGFANPATTISLFDSTLLARNSVGTTDTLPKPPRYSEGNVIAYLDAHVTSAK